MIEAYVTNLGKYVEGTLCGEWLKLPATKEEVKALLGRIGVDGTLYEETFIADYETDIKGLSDKLGEHENLDELNYLAESLSALDKYELEKFEAALEYGEYTGSVKDLINLSQNLDCYDYIQEIEDEEALGRYYAEDLSVPEHLQNYIDYEAYGRDIALERGGIFVGKGYIENGRDTFQERYGGRNDLPDEHKIFCYPDKPEKMPAKQQFDMYGKMAEGQPKQDNKMPVREER
jgi:antirestriction protein